MVRHGSSVVEQLFRKQQVVGSIPTRGSIQTRRAATRCVIFAARHGSSVAEQLFCKQQVVGSIPTRGSIKPAARNQTVGHSGPPYLSFLPHRFNTTHLHPSTQTPTGE